MQGIQCHHDDGIIGLDSDRGAEILVADDRGQHGLQLGAIRSVRASAAMRLGAADLDAYAPRVRFAGIGIFRR